MPPPSARLPYLEQQQRLGRQALGLLGAAVPAGLCALLRRLGPRRRRRRWCKGLPGRRPHRRRRVCHRRLLRGRLLGRVRLRRRSAALGLAAAALPQHRRRQKRRQHGRAGQERQHIAGQGGHRRQGPPLLLLVCVPGERSSALAVQGDPHHNQER